MRLFVALEIPATVRENLAGLLKALRAVSPQTRWVLPKNLHVTLKFVGGVPEPALAVIRNALRAARFEPPGLPEKLSSALQERASPEFGSFRTNQCHLIESKLKPSGAEYTTLE